jgi:hypothetical protein
MSKIISALPVTMPVQATVKTTDETPSTKAVETVATPVDTFEKTETKTPASRNGIKVVIPAEIFQKQGIVIDSVLPKLAEIVTSSKKLAKESTKLKFEGSEVAEISQKMVSENNGVFVLEVRNLLAETMRGSNIKPEYLNDVATYQQAVFSYEQKRDENIMQQLRKQLGVHPADPNIQLTQSTNNAELPTPPKNSV